MHADLEEHTMETMNAPEVGQVAPDFRLRGPGGSRITLSEFRGQKPVVLIFYPLAFSPVCSHQLPEVQAALPRFDAAGAAVLGISVDSHHANTAFAKSLGLDFPLLSDFSREASAAYGVLVPAAGFSGRALFVVDRDGRIAWREISENMGDVAQIPSVEKALAALAALAPR
jgi:peroxiredoxin